MPNSVAVNHEKETKTITITINGVAAELNLGEAFKILSDLQNAYNEATRPAPLFSPGVFAR